MSSIEIKRKIINQLSKIEDVSFLKAIKALVDSKAQGSTYRLSDIQKKRIRLMQIDATNDIAFASYIKNSNEDPNSDYRYYHNILFDYLLRKRSIH